MNEYRKTSTTVSLLNDHFVFCPRYRRKIFLQAEVAQRFKEFVHEVCEELQIQIVALERDTDHTYMFPNALPSLSPADIMANMKGVTSKKLRKEFPKHQSGVVHKGSANQRREECVPTHIVNLFFKLSFLYTLK